MIRVKTFDSTGVAPNGKLFASDLNAIQDAAAAITDLTQHLSIADLAIGESSLLLSRYGVGQAQLAGLLRVAAGVLPGVFTSTQRDAIAGGKRPTGLTIYNTTTGRLEVNVGTDTVPSWLPVGNQAPTYGTVLPSSPVDQQEHILVDSTTNPTYQWHFRYNGNSSSTYKWELIGGEPLVISVDTQQSLVSGGSASDLVTVGPQFTLPRSGDYQFEWGAALNPQTGGSFNSSALAELWNAATSKISVKSAVATSQGQEVSVSTKELIAALSAGAVARVRYINTISGGSAGTARFRYLRVLPVRVS